MLRSNRSRERPSQSLKDVKETKLNILALENWPSTLHGGQPLSTLDVLRGLAARGHRVTLLYTEEGDLLQHYRTFCHKVVRVSSYRPIPKKPMTLVRFVLDLHKAAKFLRRGETNIIYSNNYRDSTFVAALSKLKGVPSVIHLRVPPPTPPHRMFKQWVKAMKKVTRYVSVSNETKALWTSETCSAPLPADRISVVHNGIDTDRFTIAEPSDASRERFGVKPGDIAVSYVGRLDAVKGIDVLIRAFAQVQAKYRDAKLLIAGKPHASGESYVASLQAMADDLRLGFNVLFVGHTKDTPELFRASTVSVLPSIWPEPFGRTIPESMACGVPAVATRTGGIPEILTGEWEPFLADAGDVDQLATAILRAIELKKTDAELPQRLRQHVLEHFDVKRTVARIERVLVDVATPEATTLVPLSASLQNTIRGGTSAVAPLALSQLAPSRRASVLINNYNYGRFLRDAIDSALGQTYANKEVIVVDDGSSDDSRDVIASYGDRIIAVLQPNAGQAAAFNAAVAIATGDVLFFLDADDVYLPEKVARMMAMLSEKNLVDQPSLAFHKLHRVDEHQKPLPAVPGGAEVGEGLSLVSTPDEMILHARRYAFLPNLVPPTTGMCLTRSLAAELFPLPTDGIRICADGLVTRAAMLMANIYGTGERLANYRIHGKNFYAKSADAPKADFATRRDIFLNSVLRRLGHRDVYIDYVNSMYARVFYASDARGLMTQASRVLQRRVDSRTVRFAIGNAVQAIKMRMAQRPRTTGGVGGGQVGAA